MPGCTRHDDTESPTRAAELGSHLVLLDLPAGGRRQQVGRHGVGVLAVLRVVPLRVGQVVGDGGRQLAARFIGLAEDIREVLAGRSVFFLQAGRGAGSVRSSAPKHAEKEHACGSSASVSTALTAEHRPL